MASVSGQFKIAQGVSTVVTTGFTLVSAGAGGIAPLRCLVHPDNTNFSPITYRRNPDRTFNEFRGRVTPAPVTAFNRTLGSTTVTRFERLRTDMIVTEVWEGNNTKASMEGSFLSELINYFLNPPSTVPTPDFIIWQPKQGFEYDVQFISLTVGGRSVEDNWDITEVLSRGGQFDGGTFRAGFDGLDGGLQVGAVDRTVVLRMQIVAERTV